VGETHYRIETSVDVGIGRAAARSQKFAIVAPVTSAPAQ